MKYNLKEGLYFISDFQDCDFAPGRMSAETWSQCDNDIYMVSSLHKTKAELYDFSIKDERKAAMLFFPDLDLCTFLPKIEEYMEYHHVKLVSILNINQIWNDINEES